MSTKFQPLLPALSMHEIIKTAAAFERRKLGPLWRAQNASLICQTTSATNKQICPDQNSQNAAIPHAPTRTPKNPVAFDETWRLRRFPDVFNPETWRLRENLAV
jgi:hypothetical protein